MRDDCMVMNLMMAFCVFARVMVNGVMLNSTVYFVIAVLAQERISILS
jgi:hypothetical protein